MRCEDVIKKIRSFPYHADVALTPEEVIALNEPFKNEPACESGMVCGRYFHMEG